jgi:hypothetical protein
MDGEIHKMTMQRKSKFPQKDAWLQHMSNATMPQSSDQRARKKPKTPSGLLPVLA